MAIEYDELITHNIHMLMGRPKAGKTLASASYPKPLLYINVGNDGGGRVILLKYAEDVRNGNIKVKNLRNDNPTLVGKKMTIEKTSLEKLAELLRDLRKPGADHFNTIVLDTVGALQDDYVAYMEFQKGGQRLSQQEYGEVQRMMITIKDTMRRFSEEMRTIFVWNTHTRNYETYESEGLVKEMRIIPDLTISTATKYMKDATSIFYLCRKTTIEKNNERKVKFLAFAGPHPVMDTGTRDILLETGGFIEDFTYDKWVNICQKGVIDDAKQVLTAKVNEDLTENITKDEEEN